MPSCREGSLAQMPSRLVRSDRGLPHGRSGRIPNMPPSLQPAHQKPMSRGRKKRILCSGGLRRTRETCIEWLCVTVSGRPSLSHLRMVPRHASRAKPTFVEPWDCAPIKVDLQLPCMQIACQLEGEKFPPFIQSVAFVRQALDPTNDPGGKVRSWFPLQSTQRRVGRSVH